MKILFGNMLSLLLITCVASMFVVPSYASDAKSKYPIKYQYRAKTAQETSDLKEITEITESFGDLRMFGVGSPDIFYGVLDISGDRAISFLRGNDDFGDETPNETNESNVWSIKLNLKKYGKRWKVISYEETISEGSDGISRISITRLHRAFPYPSWDRKIKEKGGIGYYKKHPEKYDPKESPIDFPGLGDQSDVNYFSMTMKAINNNVTDGIVVGQVNKEAEGPMTSYWGGSDKGTITARMKGTEIVLYGRSEIDISYYRAKLDDDVREVMLERITPINACGKVIYKATLFSSLKNLQLVVPKFPDKLTISFNDGTSRFSCVIQQSTDGTK